MTPTRIMNDAALSAYISSNPNCWVLGMRGEARICYHQAFRMTIDKMDSRLHQCYAVPTESGVSDLVAIYQSEGRNRPWSKGFLSPQVQSALANAGINPGTPSTTRGTRQRRPVISDDERLAALKAEQAAIEQRLADKKASDIAAVMAQAAALGLVVAPKTPSVRKVAAKASKKPVRTGKETIGRTTLPQAKGVPAVTLADLDHAIDNGGSYLSDSSK